MAASAYGNFPLALIKGEIDVDTATFKALLVDSTYTLDVDAHTHLDDINAITGAEVAGTGYTAGGITLTSVTATYDSTNNRVKLDAADANFGTVTLSGVTGIIVYVSTGTATTSPLVSHHSFTASSPTGANFTYEWHANGIGYISV